MRKLVIIFLVAFVFLSLFLTIKYLLRPKIKILNSDPSINLILVRQNTLEKYLKDWKAWDKYSGLILEVVGSPQKVVWHDDSGKTEVVSYTSKPEGKNIHLYLHINKTYLDRLNDKLKAERFATTGIMNSLFLTFHPSPPFPVFDKQSQLRNLANFILRDDPIFKY